MPFDIPDHSEVFSVPKKNQIPKIAFWSFSVHVFTSSSVRLFHHGTKFYNYYSSNGFHPIVVPFGILDQSEVFSAPKKFQKKKMHFGLFLNSIWMPCWFEIDQKFIVSVNLERVVEAFATAEDRK